MSKLINEKPIPRVFISYSRKDHTVADFIAAELRNRGADVFIDYQKLTAGENFIGRLGKEIENCNYFLLIISPRSVTSKWVMAEVSWALHNDKTIIPVLLEPASMTNFFFVVNLEQVDFQKWSLDGEVSEAITKLARSMSLSKTATIKAGSVTKSRIQSEPPAQQLHKSVSGERHGTEIDESIHTPVFAQEDISELFLTAAEISATDPEQAYFLYQRVMEIDPDFMKGKAREFINRETELLRPARIAKMVQQAEEAMKVGDWKRGNQLGQDILALDSDHAEAKQIIETTRQNLECQPFYQHAIRAAQKKRWKATIKFLQDVKETCPGYGHPSGPLIDVHLEEDWTNLLSEFANLDHAERITFMSFSPDGKTLASVQEDGTIKLWSIPGGNELAAMASRATDSPLIGFSPSANIMASVSRNSSIKIWDTSTGKKLSTLTGQKQVTAIAFMQKGNLLVCASKDKSIKLWDIGSGKEVFTPLQLRIRFNIYTITFQPNGTIMATVSLTNAVKLWNILNGEELITLLDNDDDFDYESGDTDDPDYLDDSEDIASLIFSPTGNRLAAVTISGAVKLWNIPKGQELLPSLSRVRDIDTVVFSQDGELLALPSKDGNLWLWSVPKGKRLFTLSGYKNAVAFSPNGKILASASFNKVKLWSIPDGKELVTLSGHTGSVTSITFSPSGNLIATASKDKTIKLWGV